jgi:hypothetical protein
VFSASWWGRHTHLRNARWRFYHRPWRYWWRPATWAAVSGWVAWSWAQPVSYDYGGNVYYQDNSVYYGDTEVCTAGAYAEQAQTLAASAPEDVTSDAVEWLSLGVFALLKEDQEDPTMFLQLAVSKEGIIGGTYQNTVTDSALAVEGMVDKESQRAAWTIGDNRNTVLETAIVNLTKDETPVLIHFGTEQTQQWLLVRLEEPESDESASLP